MECRTPPPFLPRRARGTPSNLPFPPLCACAPPPQEYTPTLETVRIMSRVRGYESAPGRRSITGSLTPNTRVHRRRSAAVNGGLPGSPSESPPASPANSRLDRHRRVRRLRPVLGESRGEYAARLPCARGAGQASVRSSNMNIGQIVLTPVRIAILSVIGLAQVILVMFGCAYICDHFQDVCPVVKHLRVAAPAIGFLTLLYPIYVLMAMRVPPPRRRGFVPISYDCPLCGTRTPPVRIPRSWRQFLWGGWTCRKCGCEMDGHGKLIEESTEHPPA